VIYGDRGWHGRFGAGFAVSAGVNGAVPTLATSRVGGEFAFRLPIAVTARSHGARLTTSNRADFEAIRRYCKFQFEVW